MGKMKPTDSMSFPQWKVAEPVVLDVLNLFFWQSQSLCWWNKRAGHMVMSLYNSGQTRQKCALPWKPNAPKVHFHHHNKDLRFLELALSLGWASQRRSKRWKYSHHFSDHYSQNASFFLVFYFIVGPDFKPCNLFKKDMTEWKGI
jgi:hypothetical protein